MDKRSIAIIDEEGLVFKKLNALPTKELALGQRLSIKGDGPHVDYRFDLHTDFEGCSCRVVSNLCNFKDIKIKTYYHNYEIIGDSLESVKKAENFVVALIGISGCDKVNKIIKILDEPTHLLT